MRDIQEINLRELVPGSIRDDPNVAAAVEAINGELQRVSEISTVPAIIARIDQLTSAQLDHLAWQYDSKIWRDQWPVELKRSVIRSVILEKSKKGTRSAVLNALQAMGSAAIIREWFEETPDARPFTFSIVVSVPTYTGDTGTTIQEDLFLRLNDVKNVRSLYTFALAIQAEAELTLNAAARPAAFARIHGEEAT